MANPHADNINIPLNLWIGSRSVFGFLPIRYPLIALNLYQHMEFKMCSVNLAGYTDVL